MAPTPELVYELDEPVATTVVLVVHEAASIVSFE
jgi:hypothetical protein